MSGTYPGNRWKGKPPVGYGVDLAHPLARGLAGAWLFNEGSGSPTDIVSGVTPGVSAGCSWAPGDRGTQLSTPGTVGAYAAAPYSPRYALAAAGSVVVRTKVRGAGTDNQAVLVNRNYDGNSVPIHLAVGTLRNPGFGFYDGSWRITGLGGTNVVGDGKYHIHTGTYDGVTLRYYLDGVAFASLSYAGTFPSGNANALDFGRYATDATYSDALIDVAYLYNRTLSPAEIASLSLDPYQFAAPPAARRHFAVPAAGAGRPVVFFMDHSLAGGLQTLGF